MGSINHFFDLEQLEDSVPKWLAQSLKYKSKAIDVSVTKYRMLAEYDLRFPTEMGLPLQLRITVPAMGSVQGVVKSDMQSTIESMVNAELSWKLKSELRVLLPFNDNYIATGVDCRVELRAPQELAFRYRNGAFNVSWTPGSKVTDLAYYHVKPYTITRNKGDDEPTMEDDSVAIIGRDQHSAPVEIPLAARYGVNIRALASTESMKHYDPVALMEWLNKWDVNSFSNLGLVPLTVQSREFAIRYDPQGTRAKSVSVALQWKWITQDPKEKVSFESGAKSPSAASSQHRQVTNPIFQKMDGGNITHRNL